MQAKKAAQAEVPREIKPNIEIIASPYKDTSYMMRRFMKRC
jgi:hypothetical protein